MRKISNQELGASFGRSVRCNGKNVPSRSCWTTCVAAITQALSSAPGDAFAIERLCLCGITGTPPDREIHKTALGAETTVEWTYFRDAADAVNELKAQGYTILAVEQVEGAVMLDDWRYKPEKRYALVFGNEVNGVRQQVVDLCDGAIEIPQRGTNIR